MTRYSGRTKVLVCRRLHDDWPEIADLCEIPMHVRTRFKRGREPHNVWEYLEDLARLHRLEEALLELSRHDVLSLMKEGRVEPAPGPAGSIEVQIDVVSVVTFDLVKIKSEIRRTIKAKPSGVVAFCVPYGDGFFLRNICEYLASLDETSAVKEPYALDEVFSRPADLIPSLSRNEELCWADVIVPIRAETADRRLIDAFLGDLTAALGHLRHRLILVISVARGTSGMDAVCELGPPAVTQTDIELWLEQMAPFLRAHAHHPIRPATLDGWAARIAQHAVNPGGDLDLRRVYDGIERTLRHFRADPGGFLRTLPKGR
jgi:hypothetical protein